MADSISGENKELLKHIASLEQRIARIESRLKIVSGTDEELAKLPELFPKRSAEDHEQLEFNIGEFWFAKVGIVAFLLGVLFILTQTFDSFPQFAPTIFGCVFAGILVGLSILWKNSFVMVSKYLFGAGLILLYFSMMRLSTWSNSPVVENQVIEFILLTLVTAVIIYVSFRRQSKYLLAIGLSLGYLTGLLSGISLIIFISITVLALFTSYIKVKYDWDYLFIFSISLVYITHFIWFINNPFTGDQLKFVTEPSYNIIFLLLYPVIIAGGLLFRKVNKEETTREIAAAFLNSLGFLSVCLLVIVGSFADLLPITFLSASVIFLIISAAFWKRETSKYATFFYAIIGYTSLSAAIIDQFGQPEVFIWLCWQSLLVISMAIWYKSKIIIFANFFIYVTIILGSLAIADDTGPISLSIGIVALLSARIMNFQKDRLDLKTEFMRNAYLVIAFLSLPYAAYTLLPEGYVSFAWLLIAGFYFGMSIILKNSKYRWMGIMTLALSIIYVITIGIVRFSSEMRIITFVILGIVLLATSIIYTKARNKKSAQKKED